MDTLVTSTLLLLLSIVLLSQWLAEKTKTADVLFFLLGGFLATNLGLLSPSNELVEIFAFIGTIFLFFYLGLEENLANFIRGVAQGWKIAVAGVILPFAAVFGLLYGWSGDAAKAIVFGMAFAPTSIGIAFLTLQTLEFRAKSRLQPIIVAAALTDDVISLILWGIIGAVLGSLGAASSQTPSLVGVIAQSLSQFGLFVIAMALIATLFVTYHPLSSAATRHAAGRFFSKLQSLMLARIGAKRFLGGRQDNAAIIMMIFLAMAGATIAEGFGTSVALGAYFMGLIINEEHFTSDGDHEGGFHAAMKTLGFLTLWFFAPAFFIAIGLHMRIDDWTIFPSTALRAIVIAATLFAAQFAAASLTAHYIEKLPWHSATLIGIAMQGRAEVTFLVALAAYGMRLINAADLLVISLAAFILNLLIPFLLKAAARRHEEIDRASAR